MSEEIVLECAAILLNRMKWMRAKRKVCVIQRELGVVRESKDIHPAENWFVIKFHVCLNFLTKE